MADVDEPLRLLSISSIARRCAEESEAFFRREPHDSRFCFDLLRRAILEQSHDAWELAYRQYRPLVSGWIARHPSFQDTADDLDYFVNAAFDKFWSSVTADKFLLFSDLKALLRYLQMCVHSVLVDDARMRAYVVLRTTAEHSEHEAVADLAAAPENLLENVERREFWRWLEGRLHDDKERRVVYGSFFLALKPRELYEQHRETFRNQAEVYRVKENVLARLRRDPELRRFFGEDAGKTADSSFNE